MGRGWADDRSARTLIELGPRTRNGAGRDLHDETLQGLGAVRLALSSAQRADDPARWRAAITDAIAQLDTKIASVRGIRRRRR